MAEDDQDWKKERLMGVGRRLLRIALLLVVPLIAVLAGLTYYARGGRLVETENAYVKANVVAVAATVPGKVVEVGVQDNQQVKAGDLLFRLDPTPYQIVVDGAKAQMDVVRSDVASLRAEYRTTLKERAEAEEQIGFLTRQVERQERLKEKGMSRLDQYDEAVHNLAVARRRIDSVQERANRALANLNGDPNLNAERHPRFAEARAAFDAAENELQRTRVRAPVDGVVSNMKLQIGEYVERGKSQFSIIEAGPVWVEANFKETQLTNMSVGQSAAVVADAYPDAEWPAKVDTIAPATGAEFAVLPPQNATGNWVKVVQRIPVRIKVEQPSGLPPLRAGMTVTVSVDTGRNRGLPKLVQRMIDNGWLPRMMDPQPALARQH